MKVSTNEVRGPISLPVEQDAQPDHIIVHAEDELDTPHWSYSGPTGNYGNNNGWHKNSGQSEISENTTFLY